MLALILVALSLGLSNFAVAIGLGISGASARTRVQVGVIFGLFETGMPIAGLGLGRSLASVMGGAAHWISAGLLIATGGWSLVQTVHGASGHPAAAGDQRPGQVAGDQSPWRVAGDHRTWRVLVTGLAISVDNLAVGFALGAFHVNFAVAAITIGVVSTGLSLIGLELGARIGLRAGQRGELLGAVVLIAVGAAIAAGVL